MASCTTATEVNLECQGDNLQTPPVAALCPHGSLCSGSACVVRAFNPGVSGPGASTGRSSCVVIAQSTIHRLPFERLPPAPALVTRSLSFLFIETERQQQVLHHKSSESDPEQFGRPRAAQHNHTNNPSHSTHNKHKHLGRKRQRQRASVTESTRTRQSTPPASPDKRVAPVTSSYDSVSDNKHCRHLASSILHLISCISDICISQLRHHRQTSQRHGRLRLASCISQISAAHVDAGRLRRRRSKRVATARQIILVLIIIITTIRPATTIQSWHKYAADTST